MGVSAEREVGCRQVIDLGSWRKFGQYRESESESIRKK